jgi:hypothetical protein
LRRSAKHPLAAVPTLDEYLAGRNIPAAKTQIKTQPSTATGPTAVRYTSAFPVVDALNFSAAMQRVGDRVELIGRIVEVTPGSRKAGKGPPKRYVFINFGSSRGNIVKISIWSDGLAKLKEEPSTDWIGRWVSVTGLIDVPYENKRYGHKHLSITVQEDGQIQQLSETEAGVRLASISTAGPSRGVTQGAAPTKPVAAAPAAAALKPASLKPKTLKPTSPTSKTLKLKSPKSKSAKPKSPPSRGSRTARSQRPAGRPAPVPAATSVQQAAQSSGLLAWIMRWIR